MYGAILGDMIGSPYEFDRGKKTKDFPFFDRGATFTDDSVMTIAVAEALMRANGMGIIEDEEATKDLIIDMMRKWGHRYPGAGYGHRFYTWLKLKDRNPYNSYGNGSAMRVSSAGWLFDDLETTRKVACWTAEVTHNHSEGVKGADATASAIWMARNGHSKDEIRDFIINDIGYDLSRTCDDIRPGYHHVESCQETVPEAITAFLEGTDFEDVIRTAVSLGGDCDTLTCIAGSIAEAFYGVPDYLKAECERRLPDDLADILLMFHCDRRLELMRKAIDAFENDRSQEMLLTILWYMKSTVMYVPCNMVMSERDRKRWDEIVLSSADDLDSLKGMELTAEDEIRLVPDILMNGEQYFFPAFTSCEEMGEYGEGFSKVAKHIMEIINLARNNEKDIEGIVINAFTKPFVVTMDILSIIEKMNTESE